MAHDSNTITVYLEVGTKRTLAGACDWPGWCRGGRDEAAALQALLAYGPRYGRVVQAAGLHFHTPSDVVAFTVVERLAGNATTDYGVPVVAPAGDGTPVDAAELGRLQTLLHACWAALDAAAAMATGKELRTGPRGGGRDLPGVVRHVEGAEASYLTSLGGKLPPAAADDDSGVVRTHNRQVILDALAAAGRGEFASRGPRGGLRWSPRYFVRRTAWHILDHVWEIEDRVL